MFEIYQKKKEKMKKLIIVALSLIGCNGGQTGSSYSPSAPIGSCTVTQLSLGASISCPDGTTATILNGTNVTSVQFCNGVTAYPSTFAEVGLCVSNQLYGVYWDGHNAWLSSLPLGNYISTSSSLPCNFTVSTNCQVSH